MRQKGAGSDEPTAYDYLQKLEAERSAHEDARVLYVAATRAIRRLHLLGVAIADANKEDDLKPPAKGSLLALLWPGLARQAFVAALAEQEASTPAEVGLDPASFVAPLLRLREVALPESLRAIPENLHHTDNPRGSDDEEAGISLEASVGTLVHRCLELIAKNGLENWSTARIEGLRGAYRRHLLLQGHNEAEAEQGASEVIAALTVTLGSESGRWILTDHPGAAAEQAWSSRDGDTAVNHLIDRVFIADGCRWIIDYKTARLPEGELSARAESYRPQLERYAALFAAEALPLQMAIFFPFQGKLVELAAE